MDGLNFAVLDWRWTKTFFYFRLTVLINTLYSMVTFTRVNLWWWDICCGEGDRSDGDGVGMETEAVGMGIVFTGTGGMGFSFCPHAETSSLESLYYAAGLLSLSLVLGNVISDRFLCQRHAYETCIRNSCKSTSHSKIHSFIHFFKINNDKMHRRYNRDTPSKIQ